MTFEAIALGASAITMGTNDWPFEGCFSAVTGEEMEMRYNSAKVIVNAVPLPAAAWFLLGGLGVLFGFIRRPS